LRAVILLEKERLIRHERLAVELLLMTPTRTGAQMAQARLHSPASRLGRAADALPGNKKSHPKVACRYRIRAAQCSKGIGRLGSSSAVWSGWWSTKYCSLASSRL